jgi:hypothetical protein
MRGCVIKWAVTVSTRKFSWQSKLCCFIMNYWKLFLLHIWHKLWEFGDYVAGTDLWAQAAAGEKNVISIEYSVFLSLPFGNRSKFLWLIMHYHIILVFANFVISIRKFALIWTHSCIILFVIQFVVQCQNGVFAGSQCHFTVILFLKAQKTWTLVVFVTLMLCLCRWFAIVRAWTKSEVLRSSYSSLHYSYIARII